MNDELSKLAPIAVGLISSIHHSSFSFITLLNLCPKLAQLADDQVVTEAEPHQVIEQPLGALPVGRATVRAQALGKGAVNQGFFTRLLIRFVEGAIYGLPGDALLGQLARQPLPPD